MDPRKVQEAVNALELAIVRFAVLDVDVEALESWLSEFLSEYAEWERAQG